MEACLPQQEPRLVLTCNAQKDTTTVERASDIHCVAQTSGPGVLTITGWQFTADTVVVQRTGPARLSPTWDGVMVQEGDITVAGTVGGRSLADTVHVRVTDRQWPEAEPPVIERVQGCKPVSYADNCLLLYPPDTVNNLAKSRFFRRTDSLALRAANVATGPNAGYSYVSGTASPIHPDSIVVYFNKVLSDAHDPFWLRQHVCSREVLAEWVRNHEYVHVGFIQEGIRKGLANLYSIEAQVYHVPLTEMRRLLDGVQRDLFDWIGGQADKGHFRSGYPPTPCDLNSILRPTPI